MAHTLKIYKKGPEGNSEILEFKDVFRHLDLKYNQHSDSILTLLIGGKPGSIVLGPNEQLMVTYKINKVLKNFEEYPNDVARGFNIAHMPVFYEFQGSNPGAEEMLYSESILIQTPEPDFSMPFNVNAVTHALFGIIFVNTVFVLWKDQTEEEKPGREEEGDDQKEKKWWQFWK